MRGSTAGLADGFVLETRHTLHDAFLVFLDMAFASVIVTPLTVAHWQGTWNLTKMLLFPDNLLYNGIATMCIGIVGQLFVIYLQDTFTCMLHPDKHRLTFMVVSRLYTLCYSIIGIDLWLGLWNILDIYCPSSVYLMCALILLGTTLLVIFKGFRNVASPPFGISTDNSKDYFKIETMFKSSVRFAF